MPGLKCAQTPDVVVALVVEEEVLCVFVVVEADSLTANLALATTAAAVVLVVVGVEVLCVFVVDFLAATLALATTAAAAVLVAAEAMHPMATSAS